MKRIIYYCFFLAAFVTMHAHAQNLVLNGGAELFDGTTMIPNDWTLVSGNWMSQLAGPGHADSTHSGNYDFFAGTTGLGVLQQDVNVTSYSAEIDASARRFFFTAFVQSFPQSVLDSTAVLVQCLDAAKASVLYTFSDTAGSPSDWVEIANSFIAPSGTRHIRIQLIGIRHTGSDNDAYFDDISLTTNTLSIPGEPAGNAIAVIPNPAHSFFTVQLPSGKTANVKVIDLVGRTVLYAGDVMNTTQISTEGLNPGIYTVTATDAEGQFVQRIVIN
jgi:hypothetical protein